MEHGEICQAIHELELNLTERIHIQTTTLEIVNERLDNLRIAVDRHREILYGHDTGAAKGLVSDMSHIKNTEHERKWAMRTVLASFLALAGNFLWTLWNG